MKSKSNFASRIFMAVANGMFLVVSAVGLFAGYHMRQQNLTIFHGAIQQHALNKAIVYWNATPPSVRNYVKTMILYPTSTALIGSFTLSLLTATVGIFVFFSYYKKVFGVYVVNLCITILNDVVIVNFPATYVNKKDLLRGGYNSMRATMFEVYDSIDGSYPTTKQESTRKFWEKVQSTLSCCGAQHYSEWFFFKVFDEESNLLPGSCCEENTLQCSKTINFDRSHVHQKGCFELLLLEFETFYKAMYFVLGCSFAIKVVLMVLGTSMIMRRGDQEKKELDDESEEEEEAIEDLQLQQQFVLKKKKKEETQAVTASVVDEKKSVAPTVLSKAETKVESMKVKPAKEGAENKLAKVAMARGFFNRIKKQKKMTFDKACGSFDVENAAYDPKPDTKDNTPGFSKKMWKRDLLVYFRSAQMLRELDQQSDTESTNKKRFYVMKTVVKYFDTIKYENMK